jgi:hypothetical protein
MQSTNTLQGPQWAKQHCLIGDYCGPLKNFPFEEKTSTGSALRFLSKVSSDYNIFLVEWLKATHKDNWLRDGMDEATFLTSVSTDILILCCFTELLPPADLLLHLDNVLVDKKVILLSGQCVTTKLNHIKCFQIGNLGVYPQIPYFKSQSAPFISTRKFKYSAASNRTSYTRAYLLSKIIKRFHQDLTYAFTHSTIGEYTYLNYPTFLHGFKWYTANSFQLTNECLIDIEDMHMNPRAFPGDQWDVNNPMYNDSKLHFCLESSVLSEESITAGYLSEKTFKAIATGTPFIIFGQSYSYKRLTDAGFMTYNEQYGIEEISQRIDAVGPLGHRLALMTSLIETLEVDVDNRLIQDIAQYNHHYFNTTFSQAIDEKQAAVEEEVLQYIKYG